MLPQLLATLRLLQSVARQLHSPQLAVRIEDSSLRAIDPQLQQRLQFFARFNGRPIYSHLANGWSWPAVLPVPPALNG